MLRPSRPGIVGDSWNSSRSDHRLRAAPRQAPERPHPAVRRLDLRHPVRGHLRRDGPGRHALPAGRLAALRRRGRSPPSAALKLGWLILRPRPRRPSSATRSTTGSGTPSGPRSSARRTSRFFKKEYLDRTHAFYEKHGGKTIIIARFVPIIRTFAPFVAGIGRMSYGRFIAFNVIGGVGWVVLLVGAGYFFGNIPLVKKNFSLAMLAIIVISTVPIAVEYLRHRRPQVPPSLSGRPRSLARSA
ncbi:MAG: VTT domain-containing protein [Desulfobacterales bacterium]|nr:VTT domain-containing protein [Desulfobacterales bacterium]